MKKATVAQDKNFPELKPKSLYGNLYCAQRNSLMSQAISALNEIASKKKQIYRNIGGFKALKRLEVVMPALKDAFVEEHNALMAHLQTSVEEMIREGGCPKLIVLGGWNHLALGEPSGIHFICGLIKVERDKWEGRDGDPDHYFCPGEGYMETTTLTKVWIIDQEKQG